MRLGPDCINSPLVDAVFDLQWTKCAGPALKYPARGKGVVETPCQKKESSAERMTLIEFKATCKR